MSEKPHISTSQIGTLDKCELQWFFRYVEGHIVPPGVSIIRGKATHTSVNADMTCKMEVGALLPDDDIKDLARDAIVDGWENDPPLLTTEERGEGEKKIKGETVDTVVSLATLHHEELAPSIDPIHVERPFRLSTPLSHDIIGYIDICEPDAVRDTKTSGNSPAQDAADKSTQLTCYALACKVIDGKIPDKVTLDYLVSLKKGAKQVVRESTRTPADFKRFLLRVEYALSQMASGRFRPCAEDSWACCEKWCGYWKDICPFGRRGRIRT